MHFSWPNFRRPRTKWNRLFRNMPAKTIEFHSCNRIHSLYGRNDGIFISTRLERKILQWITTQSNNNLIFAYLMPLFGLNAIFSWCCRHIHCIPEYSCDECLADCTAFMIITAFKSMPYNAASIRKVSDTCSVSFSLTYLNLGTATLAVEQKCRSLPLRAPRHTVQCVLSAAIQRNKLGELAWNSERCWNLFVWPFCYGLSNDRNLLVMANGGRWIEGKSQGFFVPNYIVCSSANVTLHIEMKMYNFRQFFLLTMELLRMGSE